jgi:hypothetical protein
MGDNMNTELTTITQAEIDELAALTGAAPDTGGDRLPVLKVNYDSEDAAENRLPLGQMFITEQEIPVYAKSVRIRPLAMHYQYTDFDGDSNKMMNQTVLNTSFKQEFLDEKGTVRCGRPDSKTYKDMSEDRRKMYKNISCTRQVRCLVSYDGEDKDGNAISVCNVPAVLRLKGSNFMPFQDEFEKRLPRGRKFWDYWAEISLEKMKNGSVTYYVMHFDPDLNNPAPLDRDTIDTIKHFAAMVESDNAQVYSKHQAALSKRTQDGSVYDSLDDGADLDGEFDNEVPF